MTTAQSLRELLAPILERYDGQAGGDDGVRMADAFQSAWKSLRDFSQHSHEVRTLCSLLGTVARAQDVQPAKFAIAIEHLERMLGHIDDGREELNRQVEQEFFRTWFSLSPRTDESDDDEPIYAASSTDVFDGHPSEDDDSDIERFFILEARETVNKLRHHTQQLSSQRHWKEAIHELSALTHTLKGSASIVNDRRMSWLAHRIEEFLRIPKSRPADAFVRTLNDVLDTLDWLTEHFHAEDHERAAYGASGLSLIEEYEHSRRMPATNPREHLPKAQPQQSDQRLLVLNRALENIGSLLDEQDSSRIMLMEDLRQIDSIRQSLVRLSQALEDHVADGGKTVEQNEKVEQPQRRETAARSEEIFRDLEEYLRMLEQRLEGCQENLDRAQEISTRLWREVLKGRRISLGRMFPILERTVAELADENGVEVVFRHVGDEIQVEKKFFETLFDPLVQLIRNAISHGIESPEQRQQGGKPPHATLAIQAEVSDDHLVISVTDDGRGIDGEALRKRAQELYPELDVPRLSVTECLFLRGLTTRETIDELAGRGIGMEVVRRALNKLNGMMTVESELGHGSRFCMRTPSSRFHTKVFVVRALGHLFALPTALVCQDDDDRFFRDDRETPDLVSLSELLGASSAIRPRLLVGCPEKRFHLEVDEVIGTQDVVMFKLGRFFHNLHLVWGATHIHNGEMAYVLNLSELWQRWHDHGRTDVLTRESKRRGRRRRRRVGRSGQVLIVDDSISVREYLKMVLSREGYSSVAVADGREALEVLEQQAVDLIITDLEMPNIDGYELIGRLRASNSATTPVMIITSRGEDAHHDRAKSLGVDAFLVKPFADAELLETARQLLDQGQPRS